MLAPPAFATLAAVRAPLSGCFLLRVELGLLVRRQDGANLRHFLRVDGLATLHHCTSLLHVGAEGYAVTALAGSAGRFHERLGAIAQRLVLGLILLADRLDLRLLGVRQVEITAEAATFAPATRTST